MTSPADIEKYNIKLDHVSIRGQNITIGKGNIIHPAVTIETEQGCELVIGDNNIFEEKVIIYNSARKNEKGEHVTKKMVIGDNNHFQICSKVRKSNIGSNNILQIDCSIKSNCEVGNGCNVGISATVPNGTVLGDQTCFNPLGEILENSLYDEVNHKEKFDIFKRDLSTILMKQQKKPSTSGK